MKSQGQANHVAVPLQGLEVLLDDLRGAAFQAGADQDHDADAMFLACDAIRAFVAQLGASLPSDPVRELFISERELLMFDHCGRLARRIQDLQKEQSTGIEVAARWVNARRAAFDSKHGRPDPDTGAFEYGTGPHAEAKREYSAELAEIAEGLRALSNSARQGA